MKGDQCGALSRTFFQFSGAKLVQDQNKYMRISFSCKYTVAQRRCNEGLELDSDE